MLLCLLFLGACLVFALAYRFYGGWMSRALGIDDSRPTPAHALRDGVDYEPAPDAIVFGHHFSSIAGAGPIVGPIAAAMAFGWLPAYLWILLGVVFVGGVQDFSAMVASIRNRGDSLAQIGRRSMSPFTYRLFLLFILFVLVYVVIVFLDMTADTFAPMGQTGTPAARTGGTVATASVLYIALAALFPLPKRLWGWSLRTTTLVAVPLVFAALAFGLFFPLDPALLPPVFGDQKYFWSIVLLLYCLVASVLPVWALLQPRDYLSSFLLYACLGAGVLGILAGPFLGTSAVAPSSAFLGWSAPSVGPVYPTLCVMIACGAISGFHALISSGTTSKQLDRESSARRVGLGSMLLEAVLGLLALATVMTLPADGIGTRNPSVIFAAGLERFFSPLPLPPGAIQAFAMLAVSTFVLTSLDSCTRLARLVLQELLGVERPSVALRVLLTLAVLVLPVLVVFREIPTPDGSPMPAWRAIWPNFGAMNQLMGALALLMVFGWLRANGRPSWFVGLPMIFMFVTTIGALLIIIHANLLGSGSPLLGWMSLILLLLALATLADTIRHFRAAARASSSPPAP